MNSYRVMAFLFFGLFPFTASAASVLATVNGRPVTRSQVQTVLSMDPYLERLPHARQRVLQNLIDMEVLAQYARRHHLNHSTIIRDRYTLAKKQILADAALQNYVRTHPISPTSIQRAYNHFIAAMGTKKYRVLQILVRHKKEAQRLVKEINAGKSFAVLGLGDTRYACCPFGTRIRRRASASSARANTYRFWLSDS